MIIAGFVPCSLCDFNQRVSAVIFTQGCNFRCPYCHNGALLSSQSENPVSVDEVLRSLSMRRGVLDGVVVTGGEPTLHEDLPDLLRGIRSMHFEVKLDTNGSRPEVIRGLIDFRLVDFIAMDVKAPLDKYPILAGTSVCLDEIEESIDIIVHSGIQHEFRTTVVPNLLSDEDIRAIREMIPNTSAHRLQEFRPEHALSEELRPPRS